MDTMSDFIDNYLKQDILYIYIYIYIFDFVDKIKNVSLPEDYALIT